MRGPLSLPGPLSPRGVRVDTSRRAAFNLNVSDALESMGRPIREAGLDVEVVVEDAPLLPRSWTESVPASIVNRQGNVHTIVIYRLPIAQRANSGLDESALVWEVLAIRIADLLGVHPDDLLEG